MLSSRSTQAAMVIATLVALVVLAWLRGGNAPSARTGIVAMPVTPFTPSSISAPTTLPDFPRPDATALAQLTQIIEHYGGNTPEPIFTGEMNGFTFLSVPPADYGLCPDGERPRIVATSPGSNWSWIPASASR
jgi:hypothetical protein